MDMSKMIFVTGFARGGTSWLRNCFASHPAITKLPNELVVFRDLRSDLTAFAQRRQSAESIRERVIAEIDRAVEAAGQPATLLVNKAPANAPYVDKAARLFPESKFVFIIRDPRDVLISHQRGTSDWMKGKNSTVAGCMAKTEQYYRGFAGARELPNVRLVRYEDLHQDFHATVRRLLEFVGVDASPEIVESIFRENQFGAATGRRHVEDVSAAARKGVVGDWMLHLSDADARWYREQPFWGEFMQEHAYGWKKVTYQSILEAMVEGGVGFLGEADYLAGALSPDRPNALLLHDVDLVDSGERLRSIIATAEIEAALGVPSIFNFLPLDDVRYGKVKRRVVLDLIQAIKAASPRAAIGLHFNATERFFPPSAPSVGPDDPKVRQAIEYLHRQIDDYMADGVTFRTGTAHGYGRGRKEPNNASELFKGELASRGIRLFDGNLRDQLQARARSEARIHDVGGTLTVKRFPTGQPVNEAATYRAFWGGDLINVLTHPGNYDVHRPMCLGLRVNRERRP